MVRKRASLRLTVVDPSPKECARDGLVRFGHAVALWADQTSARSFRNSNT